MQKGKVTRLAVQSVALAFGLYGLYWVYLGLDSMVRGPWEPESAIGFSVDDMVFWGLNTIFILGGGIVVAIAWQNCQHFGAKSIQSLSGLLSFAVWVCMSILLTPIQHAAIERRMLFYNSVIVLAPMLLAYLLHRVLSKKLVAMAGVGSHESDDSKAGETP